MIVVIDNGSGKIKEITRFLNVNDYIVHDADEHFKLPKTCKGIIISGGAKHVYKNDISIANIQSILQGVLNKCPILGICYGMQVIVSLFGGKVEKMENKLFDDNVPITLDPKNELFKPAPPNFATFRNKDIVVKANASGLKVTGWIGDPKKKLIASIENKEYKIFGVQFHPERNNSTHHIIKNFVKMCETENDFRPLIISNLKDFATQEKLNKQYFKVKAYTNVIKALELTDIPIYTLDDLDKVPGIGKSIRTKIMHIFENSQNVHEQRNELLAIENLAKIYGIGMVKAKELFEKGIKTIDDLREHKDLLNNVQKKGLEYFDDIETRIPFKEMQKHHTFLSSVFSTHFPDTKWEIAGSFRRMKPDSGDIDVIISPSSKVSPREIVSRLYDHGYIKESLGQGEKKFLGICKLPRHKTNRRIDMIFTDNDQYAFSLLYFTGSQQFNVKMRGIALQKGYSMNEYGLTPKPSNVIFETEKDIFEFLDMKWVAPKDRV